MLKDGNEFIMEAMQEAMECLYVANSDEIVRQQCRAREDAERMERTLQRNLKVLQATVDTQSEEIQNMKTSHANAIAEKDAQIAEKDAQIAQLMAQLNKQE